VAKKNSGKAPKKAVKKTSKKEVKKADGAADKKGKPKTSKKGASKAPHSTSSAGGTARMNIGRYVRFRPGRAWAAALAAPTDKKTLGEWDAWYQTVLASPAK
jgi:hypothetical protein